MSDTSEPAVDLMAPEFALDPVPGFARLREDARLVRVAFPGAATPVWLITGYSDVKEALSDPRLVRDSRNVPGPDVSDVGDQMKDAIGLPSEYQKYMDTMATMDGKAHARLRKLVHSWFNVRSITKLRPFVKQTADRLVAELVQRKGGDIVDELAFPFTGDVIYKLLGLEESDWPQLREWVVGYTSGDPARIMPSLKGIAAYVEDVVERHQSGSGDDLISGLIRTRDEGFEQIANTEIIAMLLLLIDTGQRPAAQFIANGVLTLLEHPEEVEQIRAQPDLLPQAVQEVLRVATTVHFNGLMYATEDLDFAGSTIRRGDAMIAGLFSANYDPARFPEPERLDVTRNHGTSEVHVSFAPGPHYCLGAALGRMEAEAVIDRLFIRNRSLSLAVDRNDLQYHYGIGGYHLSQLPVHIQ